MGAAPTAVLVRRGRQVEPVERKLIDAAEFERLPPAQQDEAFAASIITDLDDVPEEFLAKVRARINTRTESGDAPTNS